MPDPNAAPIFATDFQMLERPGRIVTLGQYYPQTTVAPARDIVREARPGYTTGADIAKMREGVRWTRWINELNKGRQWPQKRLFERLDPMLASGIAIAVVPSHDPFHYVFPLRTLAKRLAAAQGRVDATGCLIRHTRIKRIIFGGPSSRTLHRDTVAVENAEILQGHAVLLLDDIAKSGASLVACRELLLEAGAAAVQAMALGRLVSRQEE